MVKVSKQLNPVRKYDWLLLILLAIGFTAAEVYRSVIVNSYLEKDSVALDNPLFSVFSNDAGYFLALVALILLGMRLHSTKAISFFIRVGVIALVWLYCIDILLFDLTTIRLDIRDVLRYMDAISAGMQLMTMSATGSSSATPYLPFVLTFAVFSIAYLLIGVAWSVRASALVLTFSISLFTAWVTGESDLSPKEWVYKNYLSLSVDNTANIEYSPDYKQALLNNRREKKACGPGLGLRPNIMVLVVESLSNYHSLYFSGINDWTPEFDGIARENIAFRSFYANGFTTEQGLISLLTGEIFIPGINEHSYRRLGDMGGFSRYSGKGSMTKTLSDNGYRTVFVTSGDLKFSGKGKWLESLEFDELYGHSLPDYRGWPRFHFSAAPDAALYKAVQRLVDAAENETPYLMVVETVSSHLPFYSSEGPPHTEERVMRYVDRELGRFYEMLRNSEFFDKGMLFIVSDHRAMRPSWPGEKQLFGLGTPTLVPAVLVWDRLASPKNVTKPIQQKDLMRSIEHVISESYCWDEDEGNFFAETVIPSTCVYHALGKQRELVYVRCGDSEGLVKLDGDNTRIIEGWLPDSQKIVENINYVRISHQ